MSATSTSRSVFEGVNVIDLTNCPAGALACMILADNGAAVVRVVPSELEGKDLSVLAAGRIQWHRGKDRRVVDFADERQRDECLRLIDGADVLIESYGDTCLTAWGLERGGLHRRNPYLCLFSIDSFGPHPRLGTLPPYEGLVHAAAGRMADFGRTFGLDRPAYSSSPVAGFGVAQAVVQGVCLALREGLTKGAWGRSMRTSLARSLTPFDLASWVQEQFPERFPPAEAADHVFLPYTPARASDGVWLQFACYAPHHFWQLAEVLGLGHLRHDPRFAALPGRIERESAHEFWESLLVAVSRRSSEEWMATFRALGTVGVDVVRDTQGGMEHPQAVFNGDVVTLIDPSCGPTEQIGPLVHLASTPSAVSVTPKPWARGPFWQTHCSDPPARPEGLPLDGVVVVESAAYVAAPLGPVLLADLGARVIKLEPLDGDPLRGILGHRLLQGKESVAVDLKRPEGAALARRVLAMADVFIHNYRPGVPERLGIDYERVRSVNPDIVYLYAGAYGSDGPFATMPAFHPIAGAICGNAALQVGAGHLGAARDWDLAALKEVSLRLNRANEGHPDMVSGCVYATAMVMGLLARDRFGTGQYITATMLEANAYLMSDDWIRFEGRQPRPEVDGDLLGTSSLHRLYRTADGWVFLAALTEPDWMALCRVLGTAIGEDSRFATSTDRHANDVSLGKVLAGLLAGWRADELEARAVEARLGCVRADRGGFGAFQRLDALEGRSEITQPAWHPDLGEHWRHQRIIDFGPLSAPAGVAPALGEQTAAVMAELGYSPDERRDLEARGVVRTAAS